MGTTVTTTTTTTDFNTTTTSLIGAVTSFVAKLFIDNATDFSEAIYIDSIAAVCRLPSYRIQVTSVRFVVSASYMFHGTASVTASQLRKAAAASADVVENDVNVIVLENTVNVTSTPGRRLALGHAGIDITT